MQIRSLDTIAAIATPLGEGAISIVRVSGPEAISIVDKVFVGTYRLSTTPGHRIRHGRIVETNGRMVDEVLASVFRAPHSYTGENSVEIGCHGGILVTKFVLDTLLEAGARQGDPGEFTKRAFLNGKMDLSQAEAVSDLIKASSERALRNSTAQLNGLLGNNLRSIKNELIEICSLLELQLDFTEDDIPIASAKVVKKRMVACKDKIGSILSSFSAGKVQRDGASVAIVGRPNAGKSSLFNRLLMENRSIVSPIPGTTRDFLEEVIVIDSVRFRLIDTAGLRTSGDEIESEGISRTKQAIRSSDITMLVLDATDQWKSEDELSLISGDFDLIPRQLLIIVNKADLLVEDRYDASNRPRVSALTGKGIDDLKKVMSKLVVGNTQDSDMLICSVRQYESLKNCLDALAHGIQSLNSGLTNEFIATDIRLSIAHLAEITGEVTTDDILNSIFSSFCIGK